MRLPRIGRRGVALLAFAALDFVMGLRLLTAGPEDGALYGWLHGPSPLWPWAALWLITAVCCLSGVLGDCDKLAFTAAIGIKVLWCGLYGLGWLLGGVEDGWVSASVWATFGTCVWLIAGWPEPISGEGRPRWTPPLT
ncbi:hypothetical protein ACFYPX_18065 [Micromonospora zamorensis]|uniref:hypothetical protein n=1 Tax=Micromonospora zamorensis TaxID=709883 RepID=UPI0036B2DE79